MSAEEDDDPPLPREALARLRREYRLRRRIEHLAGAEEPPHLFACIESSFLAEQADGLNSFQQGTDDLELRALPAAVKAADWERFLHYAALALNLRGLAEALADAEILGALVRTGRLALAEDAAARQPDPLRRAETRASLAAHLPPGSPEAGRLLRQIAEEFDRSMEIEPNERLAPALTTIVRHIGPELWSRWPRWLERLPPADRSPVWRAAAEAWLDRGNLSAPELWHALGQAGDPEAILGFLPTALAQRQPENPGELIARLESLFGAESEAACRAVATFLAALAPSGSDRTLALWEAWSSRRDIPWTVAVIEAGAELFGRLPEDRLAEACAQTLEPTARAALRVAALTAHPTDERAAAALAAVSAIEPGFPPHDPRLHWSLRYLEACPHMPEPELRRPVSAVRDHLERLRHEALAGDLARFLDLVARHLPEELRFQVENTAWSPTADRDRLLALARRCRQPAVLQELLDKAERFAAAVSPTEAQGFQLRGELLAEAARSLFLLDLDLKHVEVAVERLLPGEEEALYSRLAVDLMSTPVPETNRPQRLDLARQIAGKITDGRLKLLTELRLASSPDEIALKARSIYAALASIQTLESEIAGLVPLLESPFDPPELARRYLKPIRRSEIQASALLRLARHALAYQARVYGKRQDRSAVLELVRGTFTAGSDERLARLTPEIAVLGAARGASLATAEFQEATRRLLSLSEVAWPLRFQSLERLWAQIRPVFLENNPTSPYRRLRQAAEVIDAAVRAVSRPGSEVTPEQASALRPLLLAALGRLPEKVGRLLSREAKTWLGLGAPYISEPSDAAVLRRAGREPEAAARILTETLGPEKRGPLAVRLVRHGWIDPGKVGSLLDALPQGNDSRDSDARLQTLLWLGATAPERRGNDDWLADFRILLSRGEISPDDPAQEPLLGRLWSCDSAASRPALAEATVTALRTGGQAWGENGLRLWLHAHLSPRSGEKNPERLKLAADAEAALERATKLAAEVLPPEGGSA